MVVEATMQLCRQPRDLKVMVLGVSAFSAIMDVLASAKRKLELTAFEFFSEAALQKVVQHQQLQRPFDTAAQYYALLEFECLSEHSMESAMSLFEFCMEQGWIVQHFHCYCF